jgi:NADH dehydrogenase FAD-containing subunit
MESILNNIQQKNVKYINKNLTINNVSVQTEESNITTINNQFKTIYMHIPNKPK